MSKQLSSTTVSVLDSVWRGFSFVAYKSRLWRVFPDRSNKILGFHSIENNGYGSISRDEFQEVINYVDSRYEIVALPEVVEQSSNKQVAITFDDGFEDFYTEAVPVLREYDAPATVFVISDAVTDPSFDHIEGANNDYMNFEQLTDLIEDPLFTIGNHTKTHPHLDKVSKEEAKKEIVGAKIELEELFGIDVDYFSYPYNDFDEAAVDLVRESHEIGLTRRGNRDLITPDTDPAFVPRTKGEKDPWLVEWELTDAATESGKLMASLIDIGGH